jgi:hypothetical protein
VFIVISMKWNVQIANKIIIPIFKELVHLVINNISVKIVKPIVFFVQHVF